MILLLLACFSPTPAEAAQTWLGEGQGRVLGCYQPDGFNQFYSCEVETPAREHVFLACSDGDGCVEDNTRPRKL